MTGYEYHTLDNGIRIIHKQTEGKVAHLGLVINTGSRDEKDYEHGMAHLIEHVIFKGTKKRKAYHVISRLEDVGGEIDAFTTKEETCITSAFLVEYYQRSLELFADIIFNSTFPVKEIEKEKEVIYEEINSYKDNPAELIFDDFENLIFKGHPIGRSILGEPQQLAKYTRNDILKFIQNNYNTDQMVLCSVGDIPFKSVIKWGEKYFGQFPKNIRENQRKILNGYKAIDHTVEMDNYQAHCILGNRAYDISSKKRLPLELINNILGGPGMNSRLNLALRERHGFAYNIESFYSAYTDTGVVGIYFGTEEEKIERSLKIIKSEIKKLQATKLGIMQLERAKKQMIGQIAISSESKSNLLVNIGRSYLLFDKVDPLEKVYEKINKLNAGELADVANEVLNFDDLSMLIYK